MECRIHIPGALQACLPSMQQIPTRLPASCRRIVEESIELYTCKESAWDSEIPADSQNSTVPRSYNELATLMSVTGGTQPHFSHALDDVL